MTNIDNNNIRAYIIEYATILEDLISSTLCVRLGIQKENSKSFGFSSAALSFNNKVTLISDLETMESLIRVKFTTFAEIRNKFAHVHSVNSLNSYLNLGESSEKNIKNITKWYSKDIEDLVDDDKLKKGYKNLFYDLVEYCMNVSIKHEYNRGVKVGERQQLEESLKNLIEEVKKLPNSSDIINAAFKWNEIDSGTS